ncbi:glycosyltransferase [Demequina sp.]|uniref:glycosyltransferase n=1 Tax=Demequina sp. TaxID=2050685 RepID=UPI0025F3C63F|nr:glycosyltransferase [Demequina sp.]
MTHAVHVNDSDSGDALSRLPARSALIRIRVELPHTLRVLALPAYSPPLTRELELTVTRWHAPVAGWTGRVSHVPYLSSITQSYPDKGAGAARVTLRTSRPVAVHALVAAAIPALLPSNDGHGAAPRIVVAPGLPAGVLAMLPTAVPRAFENKPSRHLKGVGLADAEVALVRNDAQRDRHASASEDQRAGDFVQVDGRGHAFAEPRRARPLVDLRVHNPVGRISSFIDECATGTLDVVSPHELRLVTAPPEHDAPETELSIDLGRPLEPRAVAALRDVEHLSLAGLASEHGASPDLIAARLAELATTGTVLHSLPDTVAPPAGSLSSALLATLREPYSPTSGLARDLRSVVQRTTAMRDHGGLLELAEISRRSGGYRLLPSVSVVMSTMRPDRAARALAMLTEQTYPHLEIVAAFHGVPMPDRSVSDTRPGPPIVAFETGPGLTFGEALAAGARRAAGDLIVKVDDDDWYGPELIWDLVLAYLYSGAQVVGKTTEFLHFEGMNHTVHRTFAQERFHTQVAGGAMMLSRADYESIGGWRPTPHSTDRSVLIGVARAGGLAYRTHGLGYVYVRHGDGHTWTQEDSSLLSGAFEQWPGRQPAILERHRYHSPDEWQA